MHVSWFDLWNLLNLYISTPVSLSFFSIALITILDASTWFTYPDLFATRTTPESLATTDSIPVPTKGD